MELAELQDISRRHDDPADRLAAYLDLEEWADRESWTLWVDAWGESVHLDALRDTLDRFADGWRAVLAEVIADGARQGRWTCADPPRPPRGSDRGARRHRAAQHRPRP